MRTIILFTLISIAASAQSKTPAFEVASIKISQPGKEAIDVKPGSLTMRNINMNGCLRWAFQVQDIQVSGPAWMNDLWLDVFAKTAEPTSEADMRQMLQSLLVERFKLSTHRETKDVPALVLVIAKGGHKLKTAEKPGDPSFTTGKLSLAGVGASLDQLTSFLSRELHEAVIDQTGLKGLFDFTLDINAYVTEEMQKTSTPGPPPEANTIIANAMQAQLGLKVDAKKVPVQMLMVDHVDKTPAEN